MKVRVKVWEDKTYVERGTYDVSVSNGLCFAGHTAETLQGVCPVDMYEQLHDLVVERLFVSVNNDVNLYCVRKEAVKR